MRVEFEFHATIGEPVGEKHCARDVEDGATVGKALRAVAADHESLDGLLFEAEGRFRPHLNVLRNGEDVRSLDGPGTPLTEDDTLVVMPGVAGGRR
jgi:molybdopterin synthase sulfur carrier subunit